MNIVASGTTTAKKVPSIFNQDEKSSIFSNIDSGVNSDNNTQSLVTGNINNMLTGAGYDSAAQQNKEAMVRAAQNLRSQVSNDFGARYNQGSAARARNQVDQSIFTGIADNSLKMATEEQAMKERGLTQALNVAGAEQTKRVQDLQTGMAADQAYGYVDPITGQRVRGANELAGVQTDIQKSQVDTQNQVALGGLTLEQQRLAETARQFNISDARQQQQFADTLKKDYAQLSQQDRQFLSSLGLDEAKFRETQRQFNTSTAVQQSQFAQTLGLDQAKLSETARQFNVSTAQAEQQFKDTLAKDYANLTQQDRQFLASLGLDQAKFNEAKSQFTIQTAIQQEQFARSIGLDEAKFNEAARQFNVSTQDARDQFAQTLTKDYAALDQNQKQFLASLGLDEKKFDESKYQYNRSQSLEELKQRSAESIANAQISLDRAKLDETARQFGITTEQVNQQFADKMKFDYTNLSQQDKQFLATLGLDKAKFDEARAQWRDEFGLKSMVSTKELNQRDQELAQQASQFNSQLDWNKSQFAQTLTEAERNRIWDATQTDKKINADREMAQMNIDATKWQTDRAENLTRAGWTREDANLLAERELRQNLANQEIGLQREVERGRITQQEADRAQQAAQFKDELAWRNSELAANLTEAEKNRAWSTKERVAGQAFQSSEATLDRQLNKAIEDGRIKVQEKQLLQDALQFSSQMDFNKSELAANLSEADKTRVFQAAQQAKAQDHDLKMQQINNAFAERGYNFSALMGVLDSLPEEQAAATLQQIAREAGIEHIAKDSSGNPLVEKNADGTIKKDSNGNPVYITRPGFEQPGLTTAKVVDGIIGGILDKTKDTITTDESLKLANRWDTLAKDQPNKIVQDNSIENIGALTNWNKSGTNRWTLNDTAIEFINKNSGKLYKASNGRIYQVVGAANYGDRKSTAGIAFKDVVSGSTFILKKSNNGENTSFPS